MKFEATRNFSLRRSCLYGDKKNFEVNDEIRSFFVYLLMIAFL